MALIPVSFFIPPEHGALPTNPVAVLFHGLTGMPQELEDLGRALAREGYRVLIPCLPGHGSSVEALRQVTLAEFLESARALFPYLSSRGSVVGGISFGSLLALWSAQELERKPAAVIAISPPFRLRSKSRERALAFFARLPESTLSMLGYAKKRKRLWAKERLAYPLHSIGAAVRLTLLRKTVVSRLSKVTMPVLILQDPFDHHVHPDGTDRIVEKFGSAEVDTVWIPNGEHELTIGPKEREVTVAVRTFLRRVRL